MKPEDKLKELEEEIERLRKLIDPLDLDTSYGDNCEHSNTNTFRYETWCTDCGITL